MGLIASAKRFVPAPLKQRVRNYLDDRVWRLQTALCFESASLRPKSQIDLPAIMHNGAIAAGFAEDYANIGSVYEKGEIFGGVNPGDRRALYYLIAHFKPQRVLEIGTHVGASTVHIASALRRFVPGGRLTTADIVDVNGPRAAWKSLGLPGSPSWYLSKLGLDEITTFVTKPAADMLNTSERYDLIFLDGDHSAPAVYREISAALKILNRQGLIVLHDFYPGNRPLTPDGSVIRGPSMASIRINEESRDLAFIPLGELPWPTKSGGNATSLALVAKRD